MRLFKQYGWLTLVALLLVGGSFWAGLEYRHAYPSINHHTGPIRLAQNEYPLINPLIACEVSDHRVTGGLLNSARSRMILVSS